MSEEKEYRQWNSTLSRKSPLRAKKAAWRRTKRPKKKGGLLAPTKFTDLKKTPLRKVSKSKAKKLRDKYYPARDAFLKLPENRYCLICVCLTLKATWEEARDVMAMPYDESEHILQNCATSSLKRSTETHHQRGRAGALLWDSRFFVPSCRDHREWPHEHPIEARELHLLATASDWNSVPRDS